MKKISYLEITQQAAIATLCIYTQIILRNRGMSMTLIGTVCSVGQILAIFVPLLIGGFLDRNGNEKSVLFCLAVLMGIAYIPATVGKSDVLAIVGIIVYAMLNGCLNPIADGYINRYLNGDGVKYSRVRSFGTMAYALTLVLAGVLNFPDTESNRQIMIFIACGCLFLMSGTIVAPACPPAVAENRKREVFNPKWFDKKFYLFIAIVALAKLPMVVPDKFMSTYMTEELKLGNSFTYFTAIAPICEFVGMNIAGVLLRKNKISSFKLLLISVISISLRMILYCFSSSLVVFAVAQSLHFFCFGTFHIAGITYIDETVAKEHYSAANSVYWSVGSHLPQAIGSLIGGVIIDRFGYSTMFMCFAVTPLVAFAIGIGSKKLLEVKR